MAGCSLGVGPLTGLLLAGYRGVGVRVPLLKLWKKHSKEVNDIGHRNDTGDRSRVFYGQKASAKTQTPSVTSPPQVINPPHLYP